MLTKVVAVRNLGPTSWQIADVAGGGWMLSGEYGLDDTNNIGASLIAGEAGVVVTDASGSPWEPDGASFVAAPTSPHRQLVELLGQ